MGKSDGGAFVKAFAQVFGGVKSFPLRKRLDVTEMSPICFTKRIRNKCPLLGQDSYNDEYCLNCVFLEKVQTPDGKHRRGAKVG